jgi:hypothetical protein
MNEKIRERAKRIPLSTRLRVDFFAEWVTMNHSRTEEDIERGSAWAETITKRTLEEIRKWEKDGRPGGLEII